MPRKPGEIKSAMKKRAVNKIYNSARPKRHGFYQTSLWRKLRGRFIRQHPLCAECERQGFVRAASIVDHIVPIEEGGGMAAEENLQSLCVSCHNKKHFKSGEGG